MSTEINGGLLFVAFIGKLPADFRNSMQERLESKHTHIYTHTNIHTHSANELQTGRP